MRFIFRFITVSNNFYLIYNNSASRKRNGANKCFISDDSNIFTLGQWAQRLDAHPRLSASGELNSNHVCCVVHMFLRELCLDFNSLVHVHWNGTRTPFMVRAQLFKFNKRAQIAAVKVSRHSLRNRTPPSASKVWYVATLKGSRSRYVENLLIGRVWQHGDKVTVGRPFR